MSNQLSVPVTIELMGGLGNQLFQVCTLLAYAWREQRQVYLLDVRIRIGQRSKRYVQDGQLLLSAARDICLVGNDRMPVGCMDHIYQEPCFHYVALPPGMTRLAGYFQSPKYFADLAPQLAEYFGWPGLRRMYRHVMEEMCRLPDGRLPRQFVSMHFRLGDYRKALASHPVLDVEYYVRALAKTLDHGLDDVTVVWVTEPSEEAFVAEHYIAVLAQHFPGVRFVKMEGRLWNEEEHLLLMSACDAHIIANSTFSWWAAFLGDVVRQLEGEGEGEANVCYPSVWFGPALAMYQTVDLFPAHWHGV